MTEEEKEALCALYYKDPMRLVNEAIEAERKRATRCVQRAREGLGDPDFRSIIAAIRCGDDPDAGGEEGGEGGG